MAAVRKHFLRAGNVAKCALVRCRHLCDLAEGGWIRSLVPSSGSSGSWSLYCPLVLVTSHNFNKRHSDQDISRYYDTDILIYFLYSFPYEPRKKMLMNPWARDLFWLPYNIWISSNLQQVGKFADPAAGKTDSVATTEAQLASQNQRRWTRRKGRRLVICHKHHLSRWGLDVTGVVVELLKWCFILFFAWGLELRALAHCVWIWKWFFFLFGNLEGWFLDVFRIRFGLWWVYEFMAIYLKDE